MSTWGRMGSSPFEDLTEDVNVTLKNLLRDEWSLTGDLTLEAEEDDQRKVTIGTGWKTINNIYEIHCLLPDEPQPEKETVDWTVNRFEPVVDVHIFARRGTEVEDPTELGQLIREVRRIVGQNRELLNGMPMMLGSLRRADDPANIGGISYWHRVQEVRIRYWMASTV